MNVAIEMVLKQNLKELKLSTMFTCLVEHIRQAGESHQSYEEFLLGLTQAELRVRAEKRLNTRVRDAKVPLIKPLEEFQCEQAVGLDARQIRQLCRCEYRAQCRTVIF